MGSDTFLYFLYFLSFLPFLPFPHAIAPRTPSITN
jgi:hypothetical protein